MDRAQTGQIQVAPTPSALAKIASQLILAAAATSIEGHHFFRVALSGGSTPRDIDRLLAESHVADFHRWQIFWNITLPLLRPVLMFVIVSQTIFSFQVFVPVYQMTLGGPLDATKVIVYYIYQQGFRFQDMGYASAISVVTLVILLLISWLQMRFLRAED